MIFFFLILAFPSEFRLDIDKLGLYEAIDFFQFRDGYLFTSRIEGALVYCDQWGQVERRYQKRGQGPLELDHPFILGILSDRVVVVSGQRRVFALDSKLEPMPEPYSSLPNSIAAGIYLHGTALAPNRFLLLQSGLSLRRNMVSVLHLDGARWRESDSAFPQKWPEGMNGSKISRDLVIRNDKMEQHGTYYFKAGQMATDNGYAVEIYRQPEESSPWMSIGVLRQSVDDFPEIFPGYHAFMGKFLRLRGGYLVTFKVKQAGNKALSLKGDFFTESGKFVKRAALDSEPLACVNCPKILVSESLGEIEYLVEKPDGL